MILVLAVLLGCANAVDMPVRQAFAIEMVGPRDIGNAVAINSAMFNGARVVGPAVAGLTIGAFGMAPAFAINALSFLAVIVGLMLMRDDELHLARLVPRPRSAGAVVENLREGLALRPPHADRVAGRDHGRPRRHVRHELPGRHPATRPGRARQRRLWLRLPDGGQSGSVPSGPRWPWCSRVDRGPVRIVGRRDRCSASRRSLLAMSTSFPLSLLLMVPIGAGGIAMAATANATIQLAVPDGLRGRVMSVYTTVFSASMPIGGLLMGALASTLGILEAIAIGGVLSLVMRASVPSSGIDGSAPASRSSRHARPTATSRPRRSLQSTAPNTSAAFSPPNPNEVLSTRR